MKRPINTALHDRKIAFDRIGMDIAANIFADAVIDGAMESEFTADFLCRAAFVHHNVGRGLDLSIDDRPQIAGVDSRNMVRANLAAPLHKREHGFFANAAGAFMVALAAKFVFSPIRRRSSRQSRPSCLRRQAYQDWFREAIHECDGTETTPFFCSIPASGATDKYFPDSAGAMSAMFILVEEPARRYITRRWMFGTAQSLVE